MNSTPPQRPAWFIAAAVTLLLWALAVACEYVSPMLGFPLPGLGRSRTR